MQKALTLQNLKKGTPKTHDLKEREVVVFDLDGTLSKSKSNISPDVANLLAKLSQQKRVAVVGGGSYKQFRKQFLDFLEPKSANLKNIYVFPVTASSFYRYRDGEWGKVYSEKLNPKEKKNIIKKLRRTLKENGYSPPKKPYGKIIEDRVSQITFSALGQKTPVPVKERWNNKNNVFRKKVAEKLRKKLPKFEIRTGGLTSIDITKKGIDKKYAIKKICQHLKTKEKEIVFIGDALSPGGNDHAVLKTKVKVIKTSGPKETKKIIKFLL